MNKKKILSILLASVMGLSLCAGLTACGGGERNVELPAYTGDKYDSDGKILFNDEIFYRNDNKGISADPFVLDDTQDGRSGYYYAYSTSGVNFVYRSKDLAHWEGVRHTVDISGDAGNAIWSDIWAPEVIYDEEAEKYFMFFSASPRDSSAKYLMYLATSDKAEGPFKLVNFLDETSCENNGHDFDTSTYSAYFAKYVMFDPEDFATAVEEFGYGNLKGGSVEGTGYIQTIDPHPFVDPVAQPDGTHKKYLYFVGNDGSNVNFVVEMENWYTPKWDTLNTVLRYGYYTVEDYNKVKDGDSNVETVPYESQGINEGPTVFYNSTNNKYYLTYSTGDYKDNTYQVCQAVSDYPDKGFRKLTPDENGCFLSGGLQGSMEVSGTGHHGLITVGDKLYVIYHRHNDFNAAGELRNAGIDEIKWITVKDIENNDLLVMYANGPTSSIQPRILGSKYKNIAKDAKVSGGKLESGSKLDYLYDDLLSCYATGNAGIDNAVKETYLTESSTLEFSFEGERTVRSIMVYNSKLEDDVFRTIKRIEILSEGVNYVISNIEFNKNFYQVSSFNNTVTYVSPCAAAFAEFDEIKTTRIRITVEVPEGQSRIGLSEVYILGI